MMLGEDPRPPAPGGADNPWSRANERSIGLAAVVTGAYMVVELTGGLVSGSLALIADAGHMLADFAALSLAWFGFRLARRPASAKRTFGFGRFSILAAFINGLSLFVIAGWIVVEAAQRVFQPVQVLGGMMFWVAVGGLLVNVLSFVILRHGNRENLNIRAAALHVAGDLLGSVAAICASLVIITTGWTPIDPILSVLVALIILRSACSVIQESANILLEGSPPDIDVRMIARDLEGAVAGVTEVHHVHVWSITQEQPMITLHARLAPRADAEAALAAIKRRLGDSFGIDHSTIEIEYGPCSGNDREPGRGRAAETAAGC
jgi:cobalt-zinc-cadmium efflux system protein